MCLMIRRCTQCPATFTGPAEETLCPACRKEEKNTDRCRKAYWKMRGDGLDEDAAKAVIRLFAGD